MNKIFLLFIAFVFSQSALAEKIVENIKFNNQAVPVKLLVYTQKQPVGTVILSHGSACLPNRRLQWTDLILSWGYNAVVIDHCVKRGVKPHTAQELPRNLQVEDRIKDYVAVIDWVRKQSFSNGKVALVGHSRGGEGVLGFLNEPVYASKAGLNAGYSKMADAVVSYYPSCLLGDNGLKESAVPTLVHHGELDALTPPINCVHNKLAKDGKLGNITIEMYPRAFHTFDVNIPDMWATTPRGQVLVASYDKKAAEKSFATTKAFLENLLK
jgi:dienelactone hydrolase